MLEDLLLSQSLKRVNLLRAWSISGSLGNCLEYIWTPFWVVVLVEWHKTSGFSFVVNQISPES